jgi:hypothetical protein
MNKVKVKKFLDSCDIYELDILKYYISMGLNVIHQRPANPQIIGLEHKGLLIRLGKGGSLAPYEINPVAKEILQKQYKVIKPHLLTLLLLFLSTFSYGQTTTYFIHRYGEICDSTCEISSITAFCLRYDNIYIDNEKQITCDISKATLSIEKDGLCSFSVSPFFGSIRGSNKRSDENLTVYPYYIKFQNDNAYFCSKNDLEKCPLQVDFKNGVISDSAGKVYKKSIDAKNCNKFVSEENK